MDKILIEAGDVQVEFPTITEILQIESDQSVIEIYSGDDVGVEIVATAVGPKGDKGDTGDVTPELNQAKLDAQAAAADALLSKGIALASAGTATTKAGEAATSATSANASKNAAATSETNANASKNAAAASASAALTSENNAETAETNAETAATNAAASEANALAYRNTASTHATTATTKAGEASTSATAAAGSATAASASAADALASENAAATSAQSALGYRDTTQAHANAAAAAETSAVAAKNAAETAKTAAETAKTGADASRDAAAMSKAAAETAKASAETAVGQAVTARDAAQTARTGAETARTGAETARDVAENWAAAAAASAAEANQFDPDLYISKAANGTDFADPAQVRTSIGAQVALATVDQAEAEVGTSTTERNWTAQRVRQAIEAVAPALSHTHAIADITDLQAALNAKAPLASPAFTGTPTVPTATAGDNSTKIASTAYVRTALDALIAAAPGTMDTLNEIATALGNDPNFAATITQQLAGKANSVHSHAISDITGLQTALNNVALPGRLGANTLSVSDWDSVTENGFYTSNGALNEPGAGYWTGFVTNRANGAHAVQNLFDIGGGSADTKHYRRHRNNNVWSAWFRVLGSQQELDARFAALSHAHEIADVSGLQAALNAKAALASPALTGTPTAPTATAGTNTTQIATTAFVTAGLAGKAASSHAHAISDITGLQAALDAKLALAGGTLTGKLSTSGAVNANRTISQSNSDGEIEVKGNGTGAAYMTFHRPGQFAANIGIDTDNKWKVGGWSTGAVAYEIWHAGNDGPGSGLSADLLDDLQASQFLRSDAHNSAVTIASGNGNGMRFWNGDAIYSVYMSSQADATYGGRLDGSSDYNMYFRMGNGAGRGFVFKNGTTVLAQVDGGGTFWSIDGLVATGKGIFTDTDPQGAIPYGYESIQMKASENLRVYFGTTEKFQFLSGGNFKAIGGDITASGNLYAGASGRMAGDGNIYGSLWGNDWLSNYLANQFANKVSVGGRAYPLRIGGVDLNFNWSGQSGQPNWLWGGNDGSNMYVYNPSNFSVNYANSAGNADTVDGYHASSFAQIHGGTGTGDTNLAVGTVIVAYHNGPPSNNQAYAVYLIASQAWGYTLGVSAGTQLSGTWRCRGTINYNGGNYFCIMQRVG